MGCIEAWLPCGPGDVEEEIRCGVAGLVGDSFAFHHGGPQLAAVMRRRKDDGSLNKVNVDFTHVRGRAEIT